MKKTLVLKTLISKNKIAENLTYNKNYSKFITLMKRTFFLSIILLFAVLCPELAKANVTGLVAPLTCVLEEIGL